ncbi:MAG: GerW family sporulation protein [Moorellales bacterium]
MDAHPIEGLMKTALESIKQMVSVNAVIGEAVEAPNGTVIIPVSRVNCGFVVGGGEYQGQESPRHSPFAGGSGAGVSVVPIGFLVVGNHLRFLPIETNAVVERLLDMVPDLIDKIKGGMTNRIEGEGKVSIEVQDLRRTQP